MSTSAAEWAGSLQFPSVSNGIIFIGPIYQGGECGIACRNLVTLLAALKIPLQVIDSTEGGIRSPVHRDFQILLNELRNRPPGSMATLLVYGSPADLPLFARYEHLRPARRIAFWAIEHGVDLQSASQTSHLRTPIDEIWVSAPAQARQLSAAGYPAGKVRIVDACLRPRETIWKTPIPPFNFGPWVKKFRYLCFLDESSPFEPLLRSWFQGFSYCDDVALVMTCQPFRGNGALPRDLKLELKELLPKIERAGDRCAQVVVIDRVLSEEDWIRLYLDCDALVAPPRSYGHPGLQILEMGALGKPVIGVTDESVNILDGIPTPVLPHDTARAAHVWRTLWRNDAGRQAAISLAQQVRTQWSNHSAVATLAQLLHIPAPAVPEVEAPTPPSETAPSETNLPVRPFVPPRRKIPGVTLIGPVFQGTAQAAEDLFLLRALQAAGSPIELRMTDDDPLVKRTSPREFVDEMTQLSREPVGAHGGVHIQNRATYHLDRFRLDRWQIGRTWLDFPQIPEEWVKRTELLDEIWVPGPYSLQSFLAAGVPEEKLTVIPAGVDVRKFLPGVNPLELPELRAFNFLAFSEWYLRDGYDVLLEAYLREFTRQDDVSLILSVTPRRGQPNILLQIWQMIERQIGKSVEEAPSILLIDQISVPEERARLYATAQCLVYPHRCSAYGEACLEAAASGLPVIATQLGAPTEIFPTDTARWIEVESIAQTPPDLDEENLHGQRWAMPSVGHLRAQMRRAVSSPQALSMMGEAARSHVVASRDLSVTLADAARRVMERL